MTQQTENLCMLICKIGKEAENRYHDTNATAEEKAFYLGFINVASHIALPVLQGRHAGVISFDYEDTKKKYDEAYDIAHKEPSNEAFNRLKKLLNRLVELFEDNEEADDEEAEEEIKPKKKSTKKE